MQISESNIPTTTVCGVVRVMVDVRETMNNYICDKVGAKDGQYLDNRFALQDLGEILVSLGKDRGIKMEVVIKPR
jgi:hypothetical protein